MTVGGLHVCLPVQMMCYIPGSPLMSRMSTNQNVSPHLTVYCYDRAIENYKHMALPVPE